MSFLQCKTACSALQNAWFCGAKQAVCQCKNAGAGAPGRLCKHFWQPQLRLTCKPVLLRVMSTKRALAFILFSPSTFLMRAAASGSLAIM